FFQTQQMCPLCWQGVRGVTGLTNPTKEMRLNMAPTTFDDQYWGCTCTMERIWGSSTPLSSPTASMPSIEPVLLLNGRSGRTEHAVALMAYTLNRGLYKDFNAAVREAGRSYREYLNKFHFKTLHFLLTQALKILWEAQTPQCYQVYRGVQGIRFTAQPRDPVRFGQFTSTSFLKSVAEDFTEATFFSVSTCYGVPIRHYSMYPIEEEVLIPPFEIFEVTSITTHGKSNHIQLESMGTCSYHNCEWVTGDIPSDDPSIPL
uniref:NAD(P)(+)--arginine ADP-ribosyltransferase n=1 Tax=Calidris pygmaea TaxID=425635 RepID=A0A8C3JSH7_9CHAR